MLIDLDKDAWKLAETCNKLGVEELLGQLTEECGELVQAAQKVRRAMKGTTPVSLDDALVKLMEECADVLLCIDALTITGRVDPNGVQSTANEHIISCLYANAATAIETLLAERETLMGQIRGECRLCGNVRKCYTDYKTN